MTRVIAPSRLHFGLFHVPTTDGESARVYGGVGLMIDRPDTIVAARPAAAWQFEGMLASRAQLFARRYLASRDAPIPPLQVLVERCPAEHTGLGVGTQLGLAVAKALAVESGEPRLTAVELATRVGRGERSAIGVHGFDCGGLIVEPGKAPGEAISPLETRVILPDEWRVACFAPPGSASWHGDRERRAFASARDVAVADALRRIASHGIVPAAEAADLPAFGEAVHEFNRRAGEPFAAAQGGAYSSPDAANLIERIRELGVPGAGQSSWGPTAFAIVESQDRGLALVRQLKGAAPGWVAKPSLGHAASHATD